MRFSSLVFTLIMVILSRTHMPKIQLFDRWMHLAIRGLIVLSSAVFVLMVCTILVVVSTKEGARVTIQDGSTQACFVQPR